MKIRTGFVSNSSSSSFVLTKMNLSQQQLQKISEKIRLFEGASSDMYIYNGKRFFHGEMSMHDIEAFENFLVNQLGVSEEDFEFNQ